MGNRIPQVLPPSVEYHRDAPRAGEDRYFVKLEITILFVSVGLAAMNGSLPQSLMPAFTVPMNWLYSATGSLPITSTTGMAVAVTNEIQAIQSVPAKSAIEIGVYRLNITTTPFLNCSPATQTPLRLRTRHTKSEVPYQKNIRSRISWSYRTFRAII